MSSKFPNGLVAIKEGQNIIFYVNTGGFPLASDAWAKMWHYAKELQPSASETLDHLRTNGECVSDISVPTPPLAHLSNRHLSNAEKIDKIRCYIEKLQYNHIGLQFFDIRKDRPIIGLMEVAKRIIDDSLPIKCLEAVVLAIYLLNEIPGHLDGIEKFTIGFKSMSKGNVHRHVVLGIYDHSTGLFGALGISRRSQLGSKPPTFNTLSDLLLDFVSHYSLLHHRVKRIKIGHVIPKSNRSYETLPWNGCTVNLAASDHAAHSSAEWLKHVEKHSRALRQSTFQAQRSYSMRNLTQLNMRLPTAKPAPIERSKSQSFASLLKSDELQSASLDLTPLCPVASEAVPKTAQGRGTLTRQKSITNISIEKRTTNIYAPVHLAKRKKQSLRI